MFHHRYFVVQYLWFHQQPSFLHVGLSLIIFVLFVACTWLEANMRNLAYNYAIDMLHKLQSNYEIGP